MEVIEVYLFHGFLGLPEDWKRLETSLAEELKGKGLYCRVLRHNLWNDYQEVIEKGPHGGRDYFSVWSEHRRQDFANSTAKKIFLGYSFGGRLLMHLPLIAEDNILLVGYVSAHPGLMDKKERQERRMMDYLWAENFTELPWAELIRLWNGQEIFKNDRVRPLREEHKFDRQLLARYFKDLSLAYQGPRDDYLKLNHVEQYWFYGEEDEKFKKLVPRIVKCMSPSRCIPVPKSGHGVIFDNPEFLATFVATHIEQQMRAKEQHET